MNPFADRPPLIVVSGLPGSGKTQYCLDRFIERPAECLLVLPNAASAEAAHGALRAHRGWHDDLEFHIDAVQEWGRFVAYVLDHCHARAPMIAGRIARVAAASQVAEDATGFFEKARGTLGFHELLAEIVDEMTEAGFAPDSLEEAAARSQVSDPRFVDKVGSLAALWRAYSRTLRKLDLTTRADLPTLATDALAKGTIPVDEVWLDGFTHFTQTQLELLAHLAADRRVGVTLAWDGGKSGLFLGAGDLLVRLEERFELVHVDVADAPVKYRGDTMRSLAAGMFQDQEDGSQWDEPVWVVDTPNRLAEVEWAARWILRLQADRAYELSDFVVMARDMQSYWPLFELVFPRFDLQPSRSLERRVMDNSFVHFLFLLLDVIKEDWPRDKVHLLIESSYAFDAPDAARLRTTLRNRRVPGGRRSWQKALAEIGTKGLVALAEISERFEKRRTPAEFAGLLREVCTELGWTDRAAQGNAPHMGEDFAAAEAALRAAEALSEVCALRGDGKMSLAQFVPAWARICRLARFALPPTAGVRVVESHEEINHPPKVALLLGLLEGVFPRRMSEDPFLNDEERLELRRVTGCHLRTGQERSRDEQLRFYLSVTMPTERLLLFYPRVDDNSERIPTLYLEEVRQALPAHAVRDMTVLLSPISEGAQASQLAPDPAFALTARDRLLSAAAGYMEDREMADKLESWRSLPRFPKIVCGAAESLATMRHNTISVSELEVLNRCHFQHWAQHRAGLRSRSAGLSRTDQGSLIHFVLRDAMRKVEARPLLDVLMEELDEQLGKLPFDGQDWELELLRAYATRVLTEFARREAAFESAYNLRPKRFEWGFGDPIHDDRDPTSDKRPLKQELKNQAPILIAGSIDRVDEHDGLAILMDYKLGKADKGRKGQMEEGKSLQMPLYWLAARSMLKVEHVGVAYDGMEGKQRYVLAPLSRMQVLRGTPTPPRTELQFIGDVPWADIVRAAIDRVAEAIAQYRSASVVPNPSSDTCRTCGYGDLCRTRNIRVHDGEAWEETVPDA